MLGSKFWRIKVFGRKLGEQTFGEEILSVKRYSGKKKQLGSKHVLSRKDMESNNFWEQISWSENTFERKKFDNKNLGN